MTHIFTFCNARQRRTFSAVSKETGKIYTTKSKQVSVDVLSNMFLKRKEKWTFPVLTSTTSTWGECMPSIYIGREEQVTSYINYQWSQQMKQWKMIKRGDNEDERLERYTAWSCDNFRVRMGILDTLLDEKTVYDTPYEAFEGLGAHNMGWIGECLKRGSTLVEMGTDFNCSDGTDIAMAGLF